MLKGKTIIELTNVKTGEKEIVEDNNMVTNALNDIFKPVSISNKSTKYFDEFTPYYENLISSVLCFDTAIDENPDNYYPPANANLVGCAAYKIQNDTKNTIRGNYNLTESEVNFKDRYVKHVYDFSTSQANGTIASVCLTSTSGGMTSYGNKDGITYDGGKYYLMQPICHDVLQYVKPEFTGAATTSKYSGLNAVTTEPAPLDGRTEAIFLIDREKDCVYYFKVFDSKHIGIVKRRAFMKSVTILENVKTQKPLIEEIRLPELENEMFMGCIGYNYDPATDCLYLHTCTSQILEPNRSVKIVEIKVDSWQIRQYEVFNTTGCNLNTTYKMGLFVTDGYLLAKAYNSPYELYKIKISNSSEVVKFKRINTNLIMALPKFVINGRVYFELTKENGSTQQLLIANMSTNEIMPMETRTFANASYETNYTPVRNEPLLYFSDVGIIGIYGWYIMCNYLATINNLAEPVTKTADKTMKITYVLQEVADTAATET